MASVLGTVSYPTCTPLGLHQSVRVGPFTIRLFLMVPCWVVEPHCYSGEEFRPALSQHCTVISTANPLGLCVDINAGSVRLMLDDMLLCKAAYDV